MNDMFRGYSKRMDSIMIYKPLLELERKDRYSNLSLISIGLSVLLFILENMLRNESYKNTYNGISDFIYSLLKENGEERINQDEAYELGYTLVFEFLRNKGEPFETNYYDFETQKNLTKTFHLLTFEDEFNLKEISQKNASFRLTPDAIESLFKTREVFQEMQLSIMQLYFRQQIERKVFDGALQTAEELIFTIRTEEMRMRELISQMAKDILQIAREKEFNKMLERYDRRLLQEKEMFGQLNGLVQYTLREYAKETWSTKEEKAVISIKRIQRRLYDAMQLHENLFGLKQEVQTVFTDSMEAVMFNAFQSNINFEREVIPLVIEKQLGNEELQSILLPLIPMKPVKLFHPGFFFEPQSRRKFYESKMEELNELTFEERIKHQEQDLEKHSKRVTDYKRNIAALFEPLLQNTSYILGEYLDTLSDSLTNDSFFYTVLIQLHQRKVIYFELIPKEIRSHLDEFGQALAEFIEETRIDQVCSLAYIKAIPESQYTLAGINKEITNCFVKRGEHDDWK